MMFLPCQRQKVHSLFLVTHHILSYSTPPLSTLFDMLDAAGVSGGLAYLNLAKRNRYSKKQLRKVTETRCKGRAQLYLVNNDFKLLPCSYGDDMT